MIDSVYLDNSNKVRNNRLYICHSIKVESQIFIPAYSGGAYDNLILDSDQEQQLQEVGIDLFEFELMNDDEKIEALEDAGLDPFDFDIF
jgi:hypothetical protein